MDLGESLLLTVLGALLAETTLTVEFTEGGEGLVVVSADHVVRVSVEFGALADALANGLSLLGHDAFLSPAADVVLTGVLDLD